jgi:hypothetical protein
MMGEKVGSFEVRSQGFKRYLANLVLHNLGLFHEKYETSDE